MYYSRYSCWCIFRWRFYCTLYYTIIGIVTVKIAKPNQTEYDPAIYDWSKIEAEKDVKIKVSDREYLMGLLLEIVNTIYIT